MLANVGSEYGLIFDGCVLAAGAIALIAIASYARMAY
jgi:hypothetical protein